jgi:hypothetical protein
MSHKNDPDYHDTRAKILLEAAQHLTNLIRIRGVKIGLPPNLFAENWRVGYQAAAKELRRMASVARREHGKVLDRKRRAGRKFDPAAVAIVTGYDLLRTKTELDGNK